MSEIKDRPALMAAITDFLNKNPDDKIRVKQEIDQMYNTGIQASSSTSNREDLVTIMENLTIHKNARLKRYELGENFYRFVIDSFDKSV